MLHRLIPAMARQLKQLHVHQSPQINTLQVSKMWILCVNSFSKSQTSGNSNATTIDFFENALTFSNQSVIVNCCHLNKTIELATCGLGASCAGSCSAVGASLCPSGNCSGDCEISFELDDSGSGSMALTEEFRTRKGLSAATRPSRVFKWCSAKCNVWSHKGCCYNPVCGRRRRRSCRWMNYLTGGIQPLTSWRISNPEIDFAGKTCPLPGSLPHGNWTCEMQEMPIHGTSLLDEDAQSYPGNVSSQSPISVLL